MVATCRRQRRRHTKSGLQASSSLNTYAAQAHEITLNQVIPNNCRASAALRLDVILHARRNVLSILVRMALRNRRVR